MRVGWLRRLLRRDRDPWLAANAHRLATRPPNAEAYDYAKAIAAKRRAELRQAQVTCVHVARSRPAELYVLPARKEGA